jgi:hypothetical protein
MGHVLDYIKKNKPLLFVIIPGFIFHMIVSIPNGSYYCFKNACGLFFWGAHGHDAIWHLAVENVSFSRFPFIFPTFQGGLLQGYNYLIDLVIFLLSKIGIPSLFSYFKLLPIIWFILFTFSGIKLGRKIHDSPLFVAILLFFFYFAGSFGYLITLFHHQTLLGSSANLAMQAGLSLVNVQFAFSLVILLWILLLIKDQAIKTHHIVLFGLLVFINFGLKFYGGVVSFFIVGLYFLLLFFLKKLSITKSIFAMGILGLFALLSVLAFYNPFASIKSGSILSFHPFAIIHPIIEEPDLIYMKDMVNARYYLMEHGIGPRLIEIELFSLFIFLLFNFGTRVFGFFYMPYLLIKKRFLSFDFILLSGVIISTALAVLFVQKGQWWNTIQFFYYALFLSNFFIAYLLYDLYKSKKLISTAISIVILLATLPINIDIVYSFISFPAPTYIPSFEIKALTVLKDQPDGIVLTSHANKSLSSMYKTPLPLSVYDDTAYVAAFAHKQLYYADRTQLELTGIDFKSREQEVIDWDCSLIKKVQYIYRIKAIPQIINFTSCKKNIIPLYEDKKVIIYKVASNQ